MSQRTTPVYLPLDDDANDSWSIVAAALRAAGYTDLRPAPMPAQTFQPRQHSLQSVSMEA